MFKGMRIQTKLLIFGLLMVGIALALVITLVAIRTIDETQAIEKKHLKARATELANSIDTIITNDLKAAVAMANTPLIQNAMTKKTAGEDIADFEREMDNYLKALHDSKMFKNKAQLIMVGDRNGKVISSSRAKYKGVNLSDRGYYQGALAGKDIIGKVLLNKVTEVPFYALSTPIKNNDGAIIGVFAIIQDASYLSDIIDDIEVGTTGYVFMTNSEGMLIGHVDRSLIVKKAIQDFDGMVEFSKKMLSGENGVSGYVYKNTKKTASFAKVPSTKWVVSFTINDKEFLQGTNEMIQFAVILGIITVILTGVGIFFISGLVGKTMNIFIDGFNNISQAIVNGQLDKRMEADLVSEEFKPVVDGMNNVINEFVRPINVMAEYIDRLSKGDSPPLIVDEYRGDFLEVKNNINNMIDTFSSFTKEIVSMKNQHESGNVEFHVDAEKFQGVYKEMIISINDAVFFHVRAILHMLDTVKEYAEGNFTPKLERFPGKAAIAHERFDLIRDNLTNLMNEVHKIREGSAQGNFNNKGKTTGFSGGYLEIINGFNDFIDRVNKNQQKLEKISRYQSKAVADLSTTLEEMAGGNLTVSYDLQPGDEDTTEVYYNFKEIADNLNRTLASLNDILGQIYHTVDQVTTGSVQVSDASQALSQGATEQASSLEEISSSMMEIGSQTKHNAENSQQANIIAAENMEYADTGSRQIEELLAAMTKINESSNNISKIIKAIDEIAFQTNVLALNAAVEAARAGKYGKGFAVVAEEVRDLAGRSAKAAKETADLISDSVKKAQDGAGIAESTSKVFVEIVSGATKVNDIVGEIAAASNEQAQGISQVNVGLGQIEKVTQQVTANAEESAAASTELSSEAKHLKQMISKFRLQNVSRRHDWTHNPSIRVNNATLNYDDHDVGSELIEDDSNPSDIISLDDNEFGKY